MAQHEPQHVTRLHEDAGCAFARRRAWLAGLLVAATLYGTTLAPGLLWGDSGEIQLHILLDGWFVNGEIVRSHVLYIAVARFVYWLLPVKASLAGNLVSALGGAVTIANVTWLLASFCRTRTAIICGTALLLLSHTLWQLSTSAEVITLSTALLSAELLAFVKLVETRRLRWLAALMLANGLGASNHNFALLIWPVYAVIALRWWSAWPDRRVRTVLLAVGSLLAGMVPVLILCTHDLIARGSLGGTLESFLVGHYGHKVANFGRLPTLVARAVAMTAMNFPTPVVFLALAGLRLLRRRTHRAVYWLMVGGAFVYGAFAARYNVADQHTFLVPAFLFVAVFTAIGIDRLLRNGRGNGPACAVLVLSLVAPAVYTLVPPLLRAFAPDTTLMPGRDVPYYDRFEWFLQPWRTGYDGARRYARETLKLLPQDAWLVVDTTLVSPINYVQVTESLRRDVRLDCVYVRQDWFEPIDLEAARRARLLAGLMFTASEQPPYLPRWLREWLAGPEPTVRLERMGHLFRVACIDESRCGGPRDASLRTGGGDG